MLNWLPNIGELKVTKKQLKELNSGQIRQGDVLVVRIGECADEVVSAEVPVVLAHGEVTGHKHQFMADSRVSYLGREAGLKVAEPTQLLHEEHSPAVVIPGIYDMPAQCEWTDDLEPRRVED